MKAWIQRVAHASVTVDGQAHKIWAITDAAGDDGRRASTCILLPGDY